MLERIKELLEKVGNICDNYEKYHMPMQESIGECLPDIQWFVEQLLALLTDVAMQQDVMGILKDMLEALSQKDEVLLYDAICYGLMEYMKAVIEIMEE